MPALSTFNSFAAHLPPVLAVFGPLDWSIVGAYFLLVIVVGFLVSRKDTGEQEFFLGGRSMPTWAVAISLVAAMLSSATFVGVPDIAFKGDLTYLILNLGAMIAVFVVALFFIRSFTAGTVTIYGFLAQRFGPNAQIAVSCAFILGRLLASAARLFVAAVPLCLLLFDSATPPLGQLFLAIALIGIIGTLYAATGGVRAVVWVDTLQFALVVGTALLTIGILLNRLHMPLSEIVQSLTHPAGGTSKLRTLDLSLDPTKEFTLWTALIGNTFVMTAALGVDHDLAQRFLITKSAFRGGVSVIVSQIVGMIVVALFLSIGLLLFLFYTRTDVTRVAEKSSDIATYPFFLLHELPAGLKGLSIVGFFAVAQGSLDSAMNALAASIVTDIYAPLRKKFTSKASAMPSQASAPRVPKLTVAAVGVGMTLLAMLCAAAFDPKQSTILSFVLSLMPFPYSGMLAVFLTALFTRRGNVKTVVAALITGPVVCVLLYDRVLPLWTEKAFGTPIHLVWLWWMPIATTAAFLVCVAGRPKVVA